MFLQGRRLHHRHLSFSMVQSSPLCILSSSSDSEGTQEAEVRQSIINIYCTSMAKTILITDLHQLSVQSQITFTTSWGSSVSEPGQVSIPNLRSLHLMTWMISGWIPVRNYAPKLYSPSCWAIEKNQLKRCTQQSERFWVWAQYQHILHVSWRLHMYWTICCTWNPSGLSVSSPGFHFCTTSASRWVFHFLSFPNSWKVCSMFTLLCLNLYPYRISIWSSPNS